MITFYYSATLPVGECVPKDAFYEDPFFPDIFSSSISFCTNPKSRVFTSPGRNKQANKKEGIRRTPL